jgi:hypothetical protein
MVLDFTELYALATNLYLCVFATNKRKTPVIIIMHKIAGPVQAAAATGML